MALGLQLRQVQEPINRPEMTVELNLIQQMKLFLIEEMLEIVSSFDKLKTSESDDDFIQVLFDIKCHLDNIVINIPTVANRRMLCTIQGFSRGLRNTILKLKDGNVHDLSPEKIMTQLQNLLKSLNIVIEED